MYKKDIQTLILYYRCQREICLKSELFGDKIDQNSSKVLMLFAEIYPFLVEELNQITAVDCLTQFSNSLLFKEWFWQVKHKLGRKIDCDPDFFQIGRWIGCGFYFKICYNLFWFMKKDLHKKVPRELCLIKKVIEKQKKLLNSLIQNNYFMESSQEAIQMIEHGYILLNEVVILNDELDFFMTENLFYNH